MISVTNLSHQLPSQRNIFSEMSFEVPKGGFLAVLGENGAGKTTLLDILMGFRLRTSGIVQVMGRDPGTDPWEIRNRIAYLSEKIDMPGDWEARQYLEFHRKFYAHYDVHEERALMAIFKVNYEDRVGNLSAGEIRRLQIVGALAAQPELIIADEITAVLDIRGRRKFLRLLQERQQSMNVTVVLATNIPEGLEPYSSHLLLLQLGHQPFFEENSVFLKGHSDLAQAVMERLDAE